jgi:hypothetical protein
MGWTVKANCCSALPRQHQRPINTWLRWRLLIKMAEQGIFALRIDRFWLGSRSPSHKLA